MEVDSLGKKAVAALLKTAPPELAEVLELRQQLAKSSVKKYQTMQRAVCDDSRARGMKRYGDTEESKNAYFTEAEKCQPPLSTEELNHIWRSAQKYYAKIASQPGYVSPQEYNNPDTGWSEPLPFSRYTMAPFPVDALPEPIANYVKAVAESTQTSVDMDSPHIAS